MLALILATHLFWPHNAPIARYDFLVVAAVAVQAILLATKLERWEEAVVIFIFHVVGTVMEIFKTAHGSWIYPEPSTLRIGGVPLFSGFMYGCIGSYIARIWRLFDIKFIRYPPVWTTWMLAILAYINFFTHHYLPDIRIGLFAFSVLIFWRTWFVFTPDQRHRHMPVIMGFVLVSLFIWFAENLGTFASAWVYPNQRNGWQPVAIEKMGAWYLLARQFQKPVLQVRVGLEDAAELGGDGRDVLVVHAAGGHAFVDRVDQHGDAGGVQAFRDGVADLRGHCLLRLQALGEDFDDASDLGDADHAIRWHVGDERFAEERGHVVLAMAFDIDVLEHDDVVIALHILERARELAHRVLAIAAEPFLVGVDDTLGRIEQAFAARIVPRPGQKRAHRLHGGFAIWKHDSSPTPRR